MRFIPQSSFACLAALTLAACGGGGKSYPTSPTGPTSTPTPQTSSSPTVVVGVSDFSPATLNVTAGQTVTFNWNSCSSDGYGYGGDGGSTCVSHGVIFDDGTQSAVQSQGSYARTFATKGTFAYHCQVHGTSMAGTIIVQ